MLGKKKKGEPATFTIVERLTDFYLTILIPEKTSAGVATAMEQLRCVFGDRFPQIFRTITTDNGNEFAAFSQMEVYGTQTYEMFCAGNRVALPLAGFAVHRLLGSSKGRFALPV